jgi:hypothetical protein
MRRVWRCSNPFRAATHWCQPGEGGKPPGLRSDKRTAILERVVSCQIHSCSLRGIKLRSMHLPGSMSRGPFQANVGKGKITLWDTSVSIAPGLIITRRLPNNATEEYVVEDPGFSQGMPPQIPARYEMSVRRKDASPKPPSAVTYNIHGSNARINIGSYDNSNNIVYRKGSETELFAELRAAIETIAVEKDRADLLEHISAMESSAGSAAFVERYSAFMQDAAAHVTVIVPFLPALASLLPHH